ncbi:hypothetical protein Fmac_006811 [Flemingia macrophylla]|uniref:NYN domain-containing protein n=1 Tax=Flemingia macrophylla TaxID=520843 RepID=A0ABD1NC76_9FABA
MGGDAAKISVWWDIDKCRVPRGHDANSVAKNITSALANINYTGPVTISAYGDTTLIPAAVQHALSSTGVSLNHVPFASERKVLLVDMLLWAVDNPAPANYLLISSDGEFSNALHQLSMRRYNILLAQPPHLPRLAAAAAKVLWHWPTLSAGGPPLYVDHHHHHSGEPPVPFRYKPKYVTKTIAPPLQMTGDNDNKNNPQPIAKSLFKAPHEFFAAKRSDPVKPTSSSSSSEICLSETQCSTSNPIPDIQEIGGGAATTSTSRPPEYEVEGLIDVTMRALEFLKAEMIVPTEANITDCIRYGDPRYQMIDVRKALDFAIQQRRVVVRLLGALHVYYARNEMLYKCVNHSSGHPTDFPQPIWDRVEQFLTSSSGRSFILVSRCRYEAGLLIKRFCLEELVLGDVLKILELTIKFKKWIRHNLCGWQPITITLIENKGDDADSDFGVDQDQI